MPIDDYASIGGGGALRLKGAKVSKPKKKKKSKDKDRADLEKALSDSGAGEGSSSAIVTKKSRKGDRDSAADDDRDDEGAVHVTHKTEAQRKLDEVRRKRVRFCPLFPLCFLLLPAIYSYVSPLGSSC